ncbi:unnamed protein product, partial [Hapterophycus canaliculatus]
MLVEMYDAAKNVRKKKIMKMKAFSPLPWLHINVDLWTSRTSGVKYIGVRGFWMTEDFNLETALFAVKEFKPGREVSDERASTTYQVLEENGLEPDDVIGAVCDGGSDIKCAFNNVDNIFFEWCLAHQLNRAIIDGFGLSAAPASSKNPQARAVIFNMKKDVEHINKSEPAK